MTRDDLYGICMVWTPCLWGGLFLPLDLLLKGLAMTSVQVQGSVSEGAGVGAAGFGKGGRRAAGVRVGVVPLCDVKQRLVQWLWPGRVPLGKLTLLAGDPGMGKSYLTLDLAMRVSTGAPFPGESSTTKHPPADVLLLSAEDDPCDTIAPRLRRMGAALDRIKVLDRVHADESQEGEEGGGGDGRFLRLDEDVALIDEALGGMQAKLVVVDPISSYMGAVDSHRNTDVRRVLSELADVAARRNVAIVAVTHLTKETGGRAIYRTTGSLAFAAAARSVLLVQRHTVDAEKRVVIPLKANLASHEQQEIAHVYRIATSGKVEWEREGVRMGREQMAEALNGSESCASSSVSDAMQWLGEKLFGKPPEPAAALIEKATKDGISRRTLFRAKGRLGVVTVREGGRWCWGWGGMGNK